MLFCSRLQPVLLNQKDMCWLLKPPTKSHLAVSLRINEYRLKWSITTSATRSFLDPHRPTMRPSRDSLEKYGLTLDFRSDYLFFFETASTGSSCAGFGCQRSCNAGIFLLCVRITTSSPMQNVVSSSACENLPSR